METIGEKVNEGTLHSHSIIPPIAIPCSCQSIVFRAALDSFQPILFIFAWLETYIYKWHRPFLIIQRL